MMRPYSGAELKKLQALLISNHQIDVNVYTMGLDHSNPRMISNRILSGQVNVDTTAEVVRTLDLELSDPDSVLSINPDDPTDAAMFMNTMIRVTYSVADPAGTKWYVIPMFTGPITALERDDTTVKIQASGKDILGYSSVWSKKTFKGGILITSAMRYIIEEIMGETGRYYNLPKSSRKTPKKKKTVIDVAAVPWKVLGIMARSLGLNAWYDARGVLQIRKWSGRTVITFNDRNITTRPKFGYDPSTVINAVHIVGGKPKGARKNITYKATAPKSHPLNPKRLGRNKKGRYYVVLIQEDTIKTKAQAKRMAKKELEKGLQQSLNVEFQALPNPLMEEGDMISIRTDDVKAKLRPAQWSIPLTHDGTSTIGKVQKVSFKGRSKGRKNGRRNR